MCTKNTKQNRSGIDTGYSNLTTTVSGKQSVSSSYGFARYIEWQSSGSTATLTLSSTRSRTTMLLMSGPNIAFVYFNNADAPTIIKINGFSDLSITLLSGTLASHGTAEYAISGLGTWASNIIVNYGNCSSTNYYYDTFSIST